MFKGVGLVFGLLLFGTLARAEQPGQWLGAGVQFNQYASPQINGVLAYAKKLRGEEKPTYSYTAVNFLSVQKEPFRVMTTTETGIAQYLTRFRRMDVYALGTAGMASSGGESGTNVGYSLSGGLMAITAVRKGVTIGPYYRATKTSLSDAQHAVGIMIGIGDK
jgi:hypothetical protein